MGMNSEEIQYALDRRGFVRITAGSVITQPIQLAHLTGRVFIDCPGDVTYAGPPGRWAFEWGWSSDYVHTPCHLIFRNIDFTRDGIEHGGFLKFTDGSTMPKSLSMKQCNFGSVEGYAIDANGVGYIDSLHFHDIRSFTSGAIRWIGSSADCTGWVKIFNWRGFITSRVGASFVFKNCKNVVRRSLIDEGSPDLLASLRSAYIGPTNINDVNCSGYNEINDCWSEPWGTWETVAPDCWPYEFRSDDTSGNYGMKYLLAVNLSLNAGGLEAGVQPIKIFGGDDSANASSFRADLASQFNFIEEKTLFGGKVYPVAIRPKKGVPEYSSTDINKFDNLNADSFRDRWHTTTDSLPFQVYADRITYSGSGNEANYTAEPAQYDE